MGKGTHRAVLRLEKYTRIVSKNYSKPCWALKCDVKKFFANVDQKILFNLLKKRIKEEDILSLLSQIIKSFHSESGMGKGIPLGNLTSQVKHKLRVKYYLRYADDLILLSQDRKCLEQLINPIKYFLEDTLGLELHPRKIVFRKLAWGIDFLGYIVLPHYRLPRTKTKRRIYLKMKVKTNLTSFRPSLASYLGYLSHANSYKIIQNLKNQIWLRKIIL